MSRVPGHELQAEGAAFTARGRRIERVHDGGVGGRGFAVCSCGDKSTVLTSGYQRKVWHRAHKAKVTGS